MKSGVKSLAAGSIIAVGMLVPMAAHSATVFNEPFSSSNVPTGWLIQGEKNGPDKFTPGTPLTVYELLGNARGYLRMTTTNGGYQRASAFYTNDWVWSDGWTMEAEFRCAPGADGMAFNWIGIGTNGVSFLGSKNELLGGFGGFMGVPRGPVDTAYGLGYYTNVGGYSLQFDTYSNDFIQSKAVSNYEMMCCRNVRNWSSVPGSKFDFLGNTNFFVSSNAWLRFKLEQPMISNGFFRMMWGPSYENTCSWTIAGYTRYPAFFGVSAGAGGEQGLHDVRNFKLNGDVVPEPGAFLVLALAIAGLVRRRA